LLTTIDTSGTFTVEHHCQEEPLDATFVVIDTLTERLEHRSDV